MVKIMGDVALETISEYFTALKVTRRGALVDFGKKYKLPPWLFSRIIKEGGMALIDVLYPDVARLKAEVDAKKSP